MAGLLQQQMQDGRGAPQQGAGAPPPQGAGAPPPPRSMPPSAPPQQGGQVPAGGPGGQGGDQGAVDAPPEQAKEMLTSLLEAGLGYLYGDGMDPAVRAMAQSGDVQAGMAKVIGSVMTTAFNVLQSEGEIVPPNVMMAFGINLAKAVGEMAIQTGALPQDDPEAIEGAFADGLAQFGRLIDQMALDGAQRQRYVEMIRMMREMKEGAQGGGMPSDGGPPAPPQGAQGMPPNASQAQRPRMGGAPANANQGGM